MLISLGGSSSRVVEECVACYERTGCIGATKCAKDSTMGLDMAEIGQGDS